jgi:hypothetical protein
MALPAGLFPQSPPVPFGFDRNIPGTSYTLISVVEKEKRFQVLQYTVDLGFQSTKGMSVISPRSPLYLEPHATLEKAQAQAEEIQQIGKRSLIVPFNEPHVMALRCKKKHYAIWFFKMTEDKLELEEDNQKGGLSFKEREIWRVLAAQQLAGHSVEIPPDLLQKYNSRAIQANQRSLEETERRIEELVTEDPELTPLSFFIDPWYLSVVRREKERALETLVYEKTKKIRLPIASQIFIASHNEEIPLKTFPLFSVAKADQGFHLVRYHFVFAYFKTFGMAPVAYEAHFASPSTSLEDALIAARNEAQTRKQCFIPLNERRVVALRSQKDNHSIWIIRPTEQNLEIAPDGGYLENGREISFRLRDNADTLQRIQRIVREQGIELLPIDPWD